MTAKQILTRLKIPVTARGWHSLTSMFFCLIFLFLFVTGSLSVFGKEIDWVMNSAQRVAPTETGKLPMGRSFDAVRQAIPDLEVVSIARMPGARFADQVVLRGEAGPNDLSLAFVDPYRGEIQGRGSYYTFWFALRELHRSLSSDSEKIRIAVLAMSIPLGVILLSSLLLYRRFYAGFFRLPRRGSSYRAYIGDLHRLIGVWCLIFIVPVVLTSANLLLEKFNLFPGYYPDFRVESGVIPPLPESFDGAALDRATNTASEVLPGLAVTDVSLPVMSGMPVVVHGDLTAAFVRPVANAVYIDPRDGAVRGAHRGENIAKRLRLFEATRTLHFGTFGGLPTRILWLVFGLSMSVLAGLGAMIYAERLVMMSQKTGENSGRGRLSHIWTGMGAGRWIGLIAVLAAIGLTAQRLI